eukprot:2502918-Prymnesium_polylepis.1
MRDDVRWTARARTLLRVDRRDGRALLVEPPGEPPLKRHLARRVEGEEARDHVAARHLAAARNDVLAGATGHGASLQVFARARAILARVGAHGLLRLRYRRHGDLQRGEHVEERGRAAVGSARLAVGDASRLVLAPGERGLVLGLAHHGLLES